MLLDVNNIQVHKLYWGKRNSALEGDLRLPKANKEKIPKHDRNPK